MNLIKVLFATETFAMGVNMPARTVIFCQVMKWDGTEQRLLHGSEFIQMAGRAGRRGKDKVGTTILILDIKFDTKRAKLMMKGDPERLNSSFHVD